MISRDSAILWLSLFASILGYLSTGDSSPMMWSYREWVQTGIAVIAIITAWLRSSPLAKSTTPVSDTTTALGIFKVYEKTVGGQK
jgi:hypothetical protein